MNIVKQISHCYITCQLHVYKLIAFLPAPMTFSNYCDTCLLKDGVVGTVCGVTEQARTTNEQYQTADSVCCHIFLTRQTTQPTGMGERRLDGFGTINWWGFSPAIDFQETGESSGKPQNVYFCISWPILHNCVFVARKMNTK